MISPVLRKRPKNGKTLKTLHPLEIIHFIHFVQGGKLTRHFDGSGQNRTMTIISLYSPDLWGNKTLLHRPGSSRMLPSQSRPAAVPWLRCPVFAARAKAACKKQTAAPAPPRLFRPQDAPRLRSPAGGAKCQPVVIRAGGW